MSIDSTAIVSKAAQLGVDVTVGPYAIIEAGATLGDRCSLGPHAVVYGSVTMGDDCHVHAGAVLGDIPQDLAFKPVESFVTIGDRCTFREGVTLHRGTAEGSSTTIGNDNFFMAFSHVGHNSIVGNKVIIVNGTILAGHVQIMDGAFLSGHCGVHQFCRVGRMAMMGGGSIATKDVPPFFTLETTKLNRVTGLNTVGLRRAGFTVDERLAIKAAYKLLYRSNLNVKKALEAIREAYTEPHVLELCDFVESSKRGICVAKHTDTKKS